LRPVFILDGVHGLALCLGQMQALGQASPAFVGTARTLALMAGLLRMIAVEGLRQEGVAEQAESDSGCGQEGFPGSQMGIHEVTPWVGFGFHVGRQSFRRP
jgi:hypothetical protein